MNTQIEENYLKALYHISLHNEGGKISVNELSRHLNIKMPTVNSMMKKLSEKGYVTYVSYKPIKLTPTGKLTAALIVRKHRLIEMFLVQEMGFGWEEVHDIAEQMEHIQSPKFFEKIDELLHYPKFDPHGSPIPDADGQVVSLNAVQLSECAPGRTVRLVGVRDSSEEFLQYLTGKHIKIGTKIKITGKEDFDGTMYCEIGKAAQLVFSKIIADKLLVE
ncbi:MAG: iron (metal) dependent repressor, dtxr family protein [Bacteroidetes bacterium 47-18]|nr:MAG: iron (metal) dependent repressor, dtxr family protein [Bacteroidetes bacterium 47-18]